MNFNYILFCEQSGFTDFQRNKANVSLKITDKKSQTHELQLLVMSVFTQGIVFII
jgi:hypothetical protein